MGCGSFLVLVLEKERFNLCIISFSWGESRVETEL